MARLLCGDVRGGGRVYRARIARGGAWGAVVRAVCMTLAKRLAFGECREEDGFFVVAEDGVLEEGRYFDVGGVELGCMEGCLLLLADLNLCDLDLEWVQEDAVLEDALSEADGDELMGNAASHNASIAGDTTEDAGLAAANTETEAGVWRERACELEDELQWHRDEQQALRDEQQALRAALHRNECRSYADMVMSFEGADKVRLNSGR